MGWFPRGAIVREAALGVRVQAHRSSCGRVFALLLRKFLGMGSRWIVGKCMWNFTRKGHTHHQRGRALSHRQPCPRAVVPRPHEHLAFSIFFTLRVVFFVNAKTPVPDALPEDAPHVSGEDSVLPLHGTREGGLSMIASH